MLARFLDHLMERQSRKTQKSKMKAAPARLVVSSHGAIVAEIMMQRKAREKHTFCETNSEVIFRIDKYLADRPLSIWQRCFRRGHDAEFGLLGKAVHYILSDGWVGDDHG